MLVYNVTKLYSHANLCEFFAKAKNQHYCGDVVSG